MNILMNIHMNMFKLTRLDSSCVLFQDKVLAFDEKGESLNAHPSMLETVAMNFRNNEWCF